LILIGINIDERRERTGVFGGEIKLLKQDGNNMNVLVLLCAAERCLSLSISRKLVVRFNFADKLGAK
jgi:hypothetical protein